METESKPDTAYLERHGNRWRVSVPVPTTLRSVLGTRLKRVLPTESLEAANVLKRSVIAEFKAEIARAREAEEAGRDARRRTGEAMALRDELRTASTSREAKEVGKGIRKRLDALKRDFEANEVSDADIEANNYKTVALDGKTPIEYIYNTFTKWLRDTNPYTVGYPRTLQKFIESMDRIGVDPYIENVDQKVVVNFANELCKSQNDDLFTVLETNITFRRVAFYWGWLVRFGYAKNNPFSSLYFYESQIYDGDIWVL